MKQRILLVTVAALALFAGACSSGYDRGSAHDDLTSDDFGLTDEQADCVLDRVEDEGLEDAVVEDDIENVSQEDQDLIFTIFSDCALGGGFEDEIEAAVDGAADTSAVDTSGE